MYKIPNDLFLEELYQSLNEFHFDQHAEHGILTLDLDTMSKTNRTWILFALSSMPLSQDTVSQPVFPSLVIVASDMS